MWLWTRILPRPFTRNTVDKPWSDVPAEISKRPVQCLLPQSLSRQAVHSFPRISSSPQPRVYSYSYFINPLSVCAGQVLPRTPICRVITSALVESISGDVRPILAGEQGRRRRLRRHRRFRAEGGGARQFSHTDDKALQEERERRECTIRYTSRRFMLATWKIDAEGSERTYVKPGSRVCNVSRVQPLGILFQFGSRTL